MKGEVRVLAFGCSLNHSATLNRFTPAAASTWLRCTFAKTTKRERRKPIIRIPLEMVPSMPARLAYSRVYSGVSTYSLLALSASYSSLVRMVIVLLGYFLAEWIHD